MSKVNLIIISAFKIESEFLIVKYGLRKLSLIRPFAIYSNKKRNIHVALSGLGNLNMSNLVGFLAGQNIINKYSLIVNLGIAGAQDYKKGDLYRINKVSMLNQKISFYPLNIVNSDIAAKNLVSTDIVSDYPKNTLIDMEGYGFFSSALKYVINEQIIMLKIISDNKFCEHNDLKLGLLGNLITDNKAKILKLIDENYEYFSNYYKDSEESAEYKMLASQIKFTFSENILLKKILNKLIHQNIKLDCKELVKLNSARKILAKLETYV